MEIKNFLLGATNEYELVFADVHNYNDGRFGVSFSAVRPFRKSDIDEEYVENYLYGLGKDYLYDLCSDFDCSPNDLPQYVLENWDISELVDISCYNNGFDIDDDEWYFESIACGQHDTRNDIKYFINEEAYNIIHELWDEYHLAHLDKNGKNKLAKFLNIMEKIDKEEWIENYIRENL